MKEFKERLAQRVAAVENSLKDYLPEEAGHQKTIFEACNYSLMAGGKRIRPLLMQLTYEMLGGSEKEIEPFMAAMEMIHTSSLVHDDLPCMDNDEYRRGRKTTWVVYGYDMGVLTGDALMIYAFEVAAKAFAYTAHPERVGRAIGILAQKTGIYGMIGGQVVDVEMTGSPMTREQLDFVYRLKTGALLEASMMIGAVLAGADEETIADMEQIASNIGMAFQIRDDILDITSTTEALGKPVLSDEKNNKMTYVTYEGLEKAAAEVERLSADAISRITSYSGDHEMLEALVEMLITREN